MDEPYCPTIYFLSDGAGAIKIGYSARVRRRIDALRTASSRQLDIIGTIDGTVDHEREIHNRLSAHRGHGEWFVDCPDVRSLIDGLISGRISISITPAAASSRKAKPKKPKADELHWPDFELSDVLNDPIKSISLDFDVERLPRALASYNEARNERIRLEKQLAEIKQQQLVDRSTRAPPVGTNEG